MSPLHCNAVETAASAPLLAPSSAPKHLGHLPHLLLNAAQRRQLCPGTRDKVVAQSPSHASLDNALVRG